MTDEEAAAITACADAATPGPWHIDIPAAGPNARSAVVRASDYAMIARCYGVDPHAFGPNADFIAHARTDIPALLAERAALLEIVRAVAALKDEFYGKTIDGVKIGGWAFATEDVTPLVEQARALLTGDDD